MQDPEGTTYDTSKFSTVADREKMGTSILHHYRKVLAIRRENPEIARGEYTALDLGDTKLGGFLCTWEGSTVGVFHNTTERTLTVDLAAATDQTFSGIAASLSVDPFEGFSELNGTVLTLGGQTTVVLR